MKTFASISAAFGLVLAATPAFACRYNPGPIQRVNRAYDAVAIVHVNRGGYTGERRHDYHPWTAAGVVTRVIEGTLGMRIVEFGRSGSTAACDDGQPPPALGEDWVVYLNRWQGQLRVVESYPLSRARRIDWRFLLSGSGPARP